MMWKFAEILCNLLVEVPPAFLPSTLNPCCKQTVWTCPKKALRLTFIALLCLFFIIVGLIAAVGLIFLICWILFGLLSC